MYCSVGGCSEGIGGQQGGVAKHDLGVWKRQGAGEVCVHKLPEERH